MKATAQPLTETTAAEKGWMAVYCDLIKARLTLLVVLTTLVGFYVASQGAMDYALMLHAVLVEIALDPGDAVEIGVAADRVEAHERGQNVFTALQVHFWP